MVDSLLCRSQCRQCGIYKITAFIFSCMLSGAVYKAFQTSMELPSPCRQRYVTLCYIKMDVYLNVFCLPMLSYSEIN
jgi:hypothetical protein